MKTLLGILILLTVAGCVYTSYTSPNGTKVKQWGPKGQSLGWTAGTPANGDRPATPESLTAGPAPKSKDDLASDRANTLMILGAIVALVGVGLWVARAYFPLIPTTAGTYGVLAGAGMIAASFMLPTVPAWAWLVVLGVGLALILPGVWANWKDLKESESEVSP